MPLISNFKYRPEIDGLRAVAVVAVVLFHAGMGVPGGFVGVDVFFVISGFLITSLILKDLQEGTFTLVNFWERRARRIIPAGVVVVLATLISGWFVLLPEDYATLGRSAAWQSIFGANFFFWRQTGYFDGPADQQPLLHTWSLAVEEQFYLIFPLLLLSAWLIPVLQRRRSLLWLFGLGFFASLVLAAFATPRMPAASFYLLPTRAWELLVGALVAIFPANWTPRSRLLREAVAWIAITAIIVPCFVYTKSTPFPGLAALPPCLGTAVFIWVARRQGAGPTRMLLASRMLSLRPVVFVGLISYSLYLWHWPIFAFINYWALDRVAPECHFWALGGGFGLAVLSWRFVEMPFRTRRAGATRKAMFTFAGGGVALTATLACILMVMQGFPQRIAGGLDAYSSALEGDEFWTAGLTCVEDVSNDSLPVIGVRNRSAPVSMVVWGDSHAMAAMTAFDTFLRDLGLSGRHMAHPATVPVIGADWDTPGAQWEQCEDGNGARTWNNAVLEYLLAQKVPVVVLVARWSTYTYLFGSKELESQLLKTVSVLVSSGVKVYVMSEVPTQRVSVPNLMAMGRKVGFKVSDFAVDRQTWDDAWGACPAPAGSIKAVGGLILDPRPAMLTPDGAAYAVEIDGLPLYRDRHHLTTGGAHRVLLPMLRDAIKFPGSP